MQGSIQSVGDDRWRIRVYAGRDPLTRRKRYASRTITGTRADAETAAARLVTEVQDGYRPTAGGTVGELLEHWFTWAEPNLSPTTARGYRSKLDLYLLPALGELPLTKLTHQRLDALYTALQARGGAGGRPLAAASVRQCHAIIRRACEKALHWEWITRNPAALADPPSVRRSRRKVPSHAQLRTLLETARATNVDLAELAHTAVVTGARRGELSGLRWSDIDLDADPVDDRLLHIVRTIVRARDGALVAKPPKWEADTREIVLDDGTVDMLRARRVRARERALTCGTRLGPDAYVFADDPTGVRPLDPQVITGRWRNVAARAGQRVRFHDLRHCAATYLLDGGIQAPDVAQRLGHASTKMTLDVYGHPSRAGDRRAAELLGRIVSGDEA